MVLLSRVLKLKECWKVGKREEGERTGNRRREKTRGRRVERREGRRERGWGREK